MKAPDFRYVKAVDLDEAIALLASDEDAVVVSGGQSLLAGLALRLSSPSVLVDIGSLAELKGVSRNGGEVRLGALTRHVDVARSDLVAMHLPLIGKAITHVAHAAVRNRGTIGGSFAHSDPAAELPACAIALDATIELAGSAGRRDVRARSFFRGLFDTERRPDEIIVAVRFPIASSAQRCCFSELSRRQGDFAMIGVAAVMDFNDGAVVRADIVYFGASQPPKRSRGAERALVGAPWPLPVDWIDKTLADELELNDSPGLRSDTKLKLATVLTRRALDQLQSVPEAACADLPSISRRPADEIGPR